MSNPWVKFLKSNNGKECYTNFKTKNNIMPKKSVATKTKEVIKKASLKPITKKEPTPQLERKITSMRMEEVKYDPDELIIDDWDGPYIGLVVYQQRPKLIEAVRNLINKGKSIQDTLLLKLFNKYSDKVIDKYGFDILFKGLKRIAEYASEVANKPLNYMDVYNDPNKFGTSAVRGSMSEKNRERLLKIMRDKSTEKRY
jgi:hypothetical protein